MALNTTTERSRVKPDLSGKVALITGSSRGIGRGIAFALADAGASIAINFRTRGQEAQQAHLQIAAKGVKSIAVMADVSVGTEVDRLVARVEADLGPVDILVNNAGIARPQRVDEVTERDWDELLTINLKSCFLATQAVLPGMRHRKWGRIINLSSVAAQTGGVVGVHYAASKAGMLGLTRHYAKHLAAEGITVNAIAPALIDTEMTSAIPAANATLIPAGRLGTVDEVAQVAVMLASNAYITGQTINVNGGWFMN